MTVAQAEVPRIPDGRLLIGGRWLDAADGERFVVENPATGKPLAEVCRARDKDVAKAVAAAREAYEGAWGTMDARDRGRILRRLVTLLENHSEELVHLESLDGGKPLKATRRQDLPAVIDCFDYYAGWADKLKGDVVPARSDALTYLLREPVGVVGAIVPWNFPLMNAAWKVAPALACGCTVVLKPAELTPLSALRLGELALEAGLPDGVLNVVPGFGTEAGAALVSNPGVDKISFTGSPAVGRWIMKTAAENVTRVGLELGGKSPNIIFEDADLKRAVAAASSGIFFNAGQVCSAGSRILVQESIKDEVVEALVERSASLAVGDTLDEKTMLGPIISEKQLDKVQAYVAVGQSEGAKLVAGGNRVSRPGYYLEPTVFANVDEHMRIAREEIFGPVAAVMSFKDEQDALRLANSTTYSLAAAIWTKDVTRVHRLAAKLSAGTVWVNTYGHTDTRLPWGGSGGDSGIGRDLGEAALANYTETKTIWVNLRQ